MIKIFSITTLLNRQPFWSVYLVWSFAFVTIAAEPKLPNGYGISAKYPGDFNIQTDPAVLLSEDFENNAEFKKHWDEISDKDGKVVSLITDSPEGSNGKQALQMTATLNENTGGHLYKKLPKQVEKAFARFYVKFPSPPAYVHHFVHFGGYNPPTKWPQGGAGERPRGDERITVGIEPYGNYGKYPPPGAWNFYCYWCEMKVSGDGKYWGNSIEPETSLLIQADRWQCVEIMLKLNSKPEEADGELALWLDSELKLYVKKGTPRSNWTGMGFKVVKGNGKPFEGFRWRNNTDLKINFFWLLHYVTENSYRQNNVTNPPLKNTVIFDNIVVATDYIGLIKPVK